MRIENEELTNPKCLCGSSRPNDPSKLSEWKIIHFSHLYGISGEKLKEVFGDVDKKYLYSLHITEAQLVTINLAIKILNAHLSKNEAEVDINIVSYIDLLRRNYTDQAEFVELSNQIGQLTESINVEEFRSKLKI